MMLSFTAAGAPAQTTEEQLVLAGVAPVEVPVRDVSGRMEFDVPRGSLLKRTSTRKRGTFSDVTTTVE